MNDNLMQVAQAAEMLAHEEAVELHANIMANMRAAATAMVELCRELKEMRDKRLYAQLGYETFDAYAEGAVGIRQRQAYTYISVYEKLSPKLLADNAALGVTKLALLTQVSGLDRADFAEENDLAGMSVKEIEALIVEKNGLSEQLSMLGEEKADAEKSEAFYKKQMERIEAEAAELGEKKADAEKSKAFYKKQVEQLETEAAELREAMGRALQEAEEAAADSQEPDEALLAQRVSEAMETERAEQEKALADARAEAAERAAAQERENMKSELEAASDARKLAQEQAAQALAEAEARGREQARMELEQELAAAAQEKAAAEERAAQLQKKLELSSDKESVKFTLLFGQMQDAYEGMLEVADALRREDKSEQADKLVQALQGALAAMMEQFQ